MLDLIARFSGLIGEDVFFWFCAIVGSAMFVVQFVTNLFGFSSHEVHGDGDPSGDAGDFKWLSKQALIGFVMMFGLVSLTCKREFSQTNFIAGVVGFLGGLIAILVTGLIFKGARKLHSPGSVFKIEDAIGKEAMVYQRIPKSGVGKISLSLNGLTREMDAISHDEKEVPSFDRVQVVRKADEHTVVVISVK